MRELRIAAADALIEVRVSPGVDAALDEVAAAADHRHAFLRAAWFEAAAAEGATTLVGCRPDGKPVIALPSSPAGPRLLGLRCVPGSYWPVRSFPVAADVSHIELCDFLSHPVTRSAIGPALRIGPVNANDPSLSRLIQVAPKSGWSVLARRIAASFTLDIVQAQKEGPWPRGSTLKKNRFHEKHLASHGTLEWRFVSGEAWTSQAFDDLALVEQRSWIGAKGGDAKFLDPRQRQIWEGAVKDATLARMMNAGLLYIGGEPVAFSFGIDVGRTRYCIATSFDQRFAKHSPGKIVSYRTYVDAIARGVEFLDDGAGDGGHKSVMGEVPGPEIMDYLLVRGRTIAALLRPLWERPAP